MNIGKLNEQVTCYVYVTSADESGGFRSTEELSFTDWAFVRRSSSNRGAEDARIKNDIRYSVTMRSRLDWSGSVDGADFPSSVFKVIYRGRTLVIDGPALEDEKREFVTFEAIEQQA